MYNDLSTLNYPKIITKENKKNDTLKLIAIILMVVDHIGLVFFPKILAFRLIGRLSFPIFAYGIAIGYRYSKNINEYMLRLFIFSIVSQPVFHLITNGLNILFTLLTGLLCILCIDKKQYIPLALILVLSYVLPLDYGIYGVLTIIAFYISLDNLKFTLLSLIMVNGLYIIQCHNYFQCISLLSIFLIYKEWKINLGLNKYFGYAFYPAHLLIIIMIRYLI